MISAEGCRAKQLLVTLKELLSLLDQKILTDVSVLDVSKAFDTVPNDKLLGKLRCYGTNRKIWEWVRNPEATAAKHGG